MTTQVELRCPNSAFRLFGKLTVRKPVIVEGNLIEFACRECRTSLKAAQVFHRYNLAGELVETEVMQGS